MRRAAAAARELARVVAGTLGEADKVDHLAGALLALLLAHALHFSGKATLPSTVRLGSRAIVREHMPILCRRSWISSSGVMRSRFWCS